MKSSKRQTEAQLIAEQISLTDLQRQFDRPIVDAARYFGICESILKRVCRRHGIPKWPQRSIRSLKRKIAALEENLEFLQVHERKPIELQLRSLNLQLQRLYGGTGILRPPVLSPLVKRQPVSETERPTSPLKRRTEVRLPPVRQLLAPYF